MTDNLKYFKLKLLERWEALSGRLPLRRFINIHPRIVIGVCLASALLVFWIMASALSSKPREYEFDAHKQVYFYDLNTGELFTASADKVPPIDAPSGPLPNGEPAGVRAHVLRFELGPQRDKPYAGWLEKRNPGIKKSVYLESRTARGTDWGKGMLIKAPEGEQWLEANTPEALDVIQHARQPDSWGNTPLPAYPEESVN